ncbi:MAG: DNA polymerase IV [Tannerellaceae bacterium]|nr:DNA polymerase IV [Tannerellaceae bacterium]
MKQRKIIHIDMDAFYASVEQRDFPEYRNIPLAVGHAGARGVVSAASYEARAFGVRSAMPAKTAINKCPNLVFATPRFDVYRDVSGQVLDILYKYSDLVETLSLDEAFLDVTDNKLNMKSAIQIALEIKQLIRQKTSLTASAGVSINKFLAKIASDYKKPDGLFVILPNDAENFVENLEIERFFGVGKATAEKMHQLGIYKGGDLKRMSRERLFRNFGKAGLTYYENARAIDNREVISNRPRKSIAVENTFETDYNLSKQLETEFNQLILRLWERVEEDKFFGRTLTLKVKYSDFKTHTNSKTTLLPINTLINLRQIAQELFQRLEKKPSEKIRLLGLSIHNEKKICPTSSIQLELVFKD